MYQSRPLHAPCRLFSPLNFPLSFSIIPTSTSQSHPNGQGSDVNNTDVGSGSGLRPEGRPTDALNGTAMATLAYDAAEKYGADTTSENYLLFYQHSNGDIRKLVFNQSEWHNSELVTSDARIGTGLSVVQFGAVPTQIYMYYIDRLGYLQELRGTHGSNDWKNGTLGAMHFKAVDTYSTLSASYIGKCGDRGNIGWVYYESVRAARQSLSSVGICAVPNYLVGERNPRGSLGIRSRHMVRRHPILRPRSGIRFLDKSRHKPHHCLANVQFYEGSTDEGTLLFGLLQERDYGVDYRRVAIYRLKNVAKYADWRPCRSEWNNCPQLNAWPCRYYGEWVSNPILSERFRDGHGAKQYRFPNWLESRVRRSMGWQSLDQRDW